MKKVGTYILFSLMFGGLFSCSTAYKPQHTGDTYTHKKSKDLHKTKRHLFEKGQDKEKPFW